MWQQLDVQDLAVARRLCFEPGRGLNVITGETGAGKSLLIIALGLALGRRAGAEVIRQGAPEARVEAQLRIDPQDGGLQRRLQELGLPAAEERLHILRRVCRQGRGGVWINDQRVALRDLRSLAPRLVRVIGQHAQRQLLDREHHRVLVDRAGQLGPEGSKMQRAWRDLCAARSAHASSVQRLSDRDARAERLRDQLARAEALGLVNGELEDLRAEAHALEHSEELGSRLGQASLALYEQEGAVVELLAAASRQLGAAVRIQPAHASAAERLEDLREQVEDLAREINAAAHSVQNSPGRLAWVEDRIAAAERLATSLGCEPAELPAAVHQLRLELEDLAMAEAAAEAANQRVERSLERAERVAADLSSARARVCAQLSADLQEQLVQLSMPSARVSIQQEATALGPTGSDRVEIHLSANPGEALRPLAEVASGGELSRMLLALQLVEARSGPGTLVLDEGDTGLGGVAADEVARALRRACEQDNLQIVAVSHLAQVAAAAHQHHRVRKSTLDGRSLSQVQRLGARARVGELARMVGGRSGGAASRACARELIAAFRPGAKRPKVA